MKKKNQKDNKGKKVPQQPNTFVPQNLLSLLREQKLITCPENLKENIIEYKPEAIPYDIPQEQIDKSEEEINNELLPEELIKKEKEKTIERIMEKKLSKLDKKKEKGNKKEKEKEKLETIEIKEENNQQKEKEKSEEEELIYKLYEDPMHNEIINNLPLSFIKLTKNNFKWLRPEEYIINETLDKEIKRLYPKKKYMQMSLKINML